MGAGMVQDFAARDIAANVDVILLEVMRGRFDFIVNEMELTLLRSSYSPLVKEALDATAALFDSEGRTLAQAEALPAHLGVMAVAMRRVATHYPQDTAAEGDVYIFNDPYDGGTHLPDVLIAMPVFFGSELVGYTATICHHQDVGGSAPGSTAPDAVDLHAEGIRLPLMKLVDRGHRVESLVALLRANVRVPGNFIGDLEAQIAACGSGARGLRELYERYGLDTVRMASDELMHYAERLTREAIQRLPNGRFEFTDYLDDDGNDAGPIAIRVCVEIAGSDITFDFDGTGPQVRGAINCVDASTLAVVLCAVRSLTGATIPNNDGCFRAISVKLPPGSIVNCAYPAPVGCRAITMKRTSDVVFGALAKAAQGLIPAAPSGQTNILYVGGFDENTGRRYVGFLGVPLPGGMGARSDRDGIDVVESDVTNNMHYPTECCEAELPMRVESIELWQDSGGPGEYRGGLGYIAVVRWLGSDALVTMRRDRHRFAPWGLMGGSESWPCRAVLTGASGEERELASKEVFTIHRGDRLQIWTAGGGGYGSAARRNPEMVLADVRDGRVSAAAAISEYGVRIVDDAIVPDQEARAAAGSRPQRRPWPADWERQR